MSTMYFAYGSNMNLDQMAMRCPGAVLGQIVCLPNWQYFINGNGYAGIEKKEGSKVLGCLWTLKEKHWRALDHYEGVAEGYYKRVEMEVELLGQNTFARVWVYLSCNYQYGIPQPRYQIAVVEGARQVQLPVDYLPILESWVNGCPD